MAHTHSHARLEALESRRLLSAGDLVSTFGTDGMVDVGKPISPMESAVVPVAGDKFLVLTAKSAQQQFQTPVGVIERHNADGSLDATFATDGVADYSFGEGFYGAKAAADGKIIVLSSTYQTPTVTRLNAD